MKRKLKVWFIAAGLFFAGCSSSSPVSNSRVEQDIYLPRAKATIEERIKLEKQLTEFLNNTNLVFSVRTKSQDEDYEYFGNGFIMKNEIIATANHLINNRADPSILIDDKRQEVKILGKVHTRDLAFLEIKKNLLPTFSVKFAAAQSIFKSLSKKENDLALKETLVGVKCVFENHTRIIIGELRSWDSENNEFDFLAKDTNPQGCSGTPVFTFENSIIGILQSHVGQARFALDIKDVIEALEIIDNIEKSNGN